MSYVPRNGYGLYSHLTEEEMDKLFSSPSESSIMFGPVTELDVMFGREFAANPDFAILQWNELVLGQEFQGYEGFNYYISDAIDNSPNEPRRLQRLRDELTDDPGLPLPSPFDD